MTELAAIVPTRGRPHGFTELVGAIHDTATSKIRVIGCVDDDDPTRDQYEVPGPPSVDLWIGPRRTLSGWTNYAAALLLKSDDPPRYLASLGDDHRPRTPGWDLRLIEAIEALSAPGIAYGDDLAQGPQLCTAWVVSAEVVRVVGWMMLPTCEHMYVDNAVLELGRASARIVYRPDVVIEHLHPVAGKSGWDDTYRETNTAQRYAADLAAFEAWKRGGLAADVEKLLTVRGV